MPQKRSRHMQTTFFGLVARRRLSSSEGAPEGVGQLATSRESELHFSEVKVKKGNTFNSSGQTSNSLDLEID